ncbi:MAG: hypothetical protein ACR2MX_10190, partial [Cyclobacteriaceae bacterium]
MKTQFLVYIMFLIPVLSQAQTKSENLFYLVDTPESFASFQSHIDQISIVCPQTFLVSKEGVITGMVDPRILKIAKDNQVRVMPLIVNKGFNQQLLHE